MDSVLLKPPISTGVSSVMLNLSLILTKIATFSGVGILDLWLHLNLMSIFKLFEVLHLQPVVSVVQYNSAYVLNQ